ncbi:MAG: hypothetical protein J6B97_09175 [Bacteroidales bacterium]|nr:hypothetical protein [Bacteroidales bacterium]
MMDKNLVLVAMRMNLVVRMSQIARPVAYDHVSSDLLPLRHSVKKLVQISVVAESLLTDFAISLTVVKPGLEVGKLDQLSIGPRLHRHSLPNIV